MFKTEKGFKYDVQSDTNEVEYKIAPNDVLTFRLFTNNGFKLIDASSEGNTQIRNLDVGISYYVEFEGKINLPIIGRVDVSGKTLREAEFYLEAGFQIVTDFTIRVKCDLLAIICFRNGYGIDNFQLIICAGVVQCDEVIISVLYLNLYSVS